MTITAPNGQKVRTATIFGFVAFAARPGGTYRRVKASNTHAVVVKAAAGYRSLGWSTFTAQVATGTITTVNGVTQAAVAASVVVRAHTCSSCGGACSGLRVRTAAGSITVCNTACALVAITTHGAA